MLCIRQTDRQTDVRYGALREHFKAPAFNDKKYTVNRGGTFSSSTHDVCEDHLHIISSPFIETFVHVFMTRSLLGVTETRPVGDESFPVYAMHGETELAIGKKIYPGMVPQQANWRDKTTCCVVSDDDSAPSPLSNTSRLPLTIIPSAYSYGFPGGLGYV